MSCVQNNDYGDYSYGSLNPESPFIDSVTGQPCNYSIGNTNGGTVYGNTGGSNKLETILASVLSGFALLQHAPYVPTANNPYNQPVVTPVILGGGGGGNYGGGSGSLNPNNPSKNTAVNQTLGKVETWVKANPGAAAIGGLVAAALFLPALMGKNKGR